MKNAYYYLPHLVLFYFNFFIKVSATYYKNIPPNENKSKPKNSRYSTQKSNLRRLLPNYIKRQLLYTTLAITTAVLAGRCPSRCRGCGLAGTPEALNVMS